MRVEIISAHVLRQSSESVMADRDVEVDVEARNVKRSLVLSSLREKLLKKVDDSKASSSAVSETSTSRSSEVKGILRRKLLGEELKNTGICRPRSTPKSVKRSSLGDVFQEPDGEFHDTKRIRLEFQEGAKTSEQDLSDADPGLVEISTDDNEEQEVDHGKQRCWPPVSPQPPFRLLERYRKSSTSFEDTSEVVEEHTSPNKSPRRSPRLVNKKIVLRERLLIKKAAPKLLQECYKSYKRSEEIKMEESVGREEDGRSSSQCFMFTSKQKQVFSDTGVPFDPITVVVWPSWKYKVVVRHFEVIEEGIVCVDSSDPKSFHLLLDKVLDYRLCPGITPSLVEQLGYIPKYVNKFTWPEVRVCAVKCTKLIMKRSGRGEHHCRDCTNAKKEVSRHVKRKESLTPGEKLMRQLPSSRVKLSSLSPYSKKQRMKNISQSRRNLKRAVERYRKKCSVKLTDEQAEELEQLVSCIESNESGGKQELEKIFKEAEENKIGNGTKLKMIWNEDRKNFFKDQAKNCKIIFIFHCKLVNPDHSSRQD